MKRHFLFIILLICTYSLYSQYYVRGDHNSWGLTNQLIQRTGIASGSTYSTVLQAGFDQQFKIADGSWSNQWGGGYWITSYDQYWTIGPNGGNAIWKGTILSYTQINTLNPAGYINQNLPTGIMTLSASPVSVPNVSQVGTDIGGGNYQISSTMAQTVDITISQAKSSEEKIYLRYSNDNWTTNNWILATGSGTSYTAIIPGQVNGTTVSYYVLTTTLTHSAGNELDQYPDLLTLNYNTNGGANFIYTINITLPIKLIAFDVLNLKENRSLISWQTSTETKNDHFLVEWSRDAKNFEEIAKITVKGTTREAQNYSYIHETPATGKNYYRLSQVDLDGRKETYPVKSIYFVSKEKGFEITPTLVYNNMKVEFKHPVENGRLHLFNMDGQIINSYILAEGIDVLRIDVPDLPKGQYIARYIDGEESLSKKFIKQ